jgi:hypothetical protein
VLVESLETPLMALAFRQGRFISLYLPFLLEDTNWMLRPSFPIFITNLLDFCLEEAQSGQLVQVQAGQPAAIPVGGQDTPPEKIRVTGPDGKNYSLPVESDPVLFASTDKTGLYQVDIPGQPLQYLAVNLLDPDESNIAPEEELELAGQTIAAGGGDLRTNREIWKSLASLALVLFLLEWWVYHRRIGV